MSSKGNKKKRRPVNPTRGYATQSVPGKDQTKVVEPSAESENLEGSSTTPQNRSADIEKPDITTIPSLVSATKNGNCIGNEFDLERYDTLNFCKIHSSGVRKDGNRCLQDIQADVRAFRDSSEPLSVRSLSVVFDKVEDLAREELDRGSLISSDASRSFEASDDVMLRRLWILYYVLNGMKFDRPFIVQALKHVYKFRTRASETPYIWGLADCLDWLALNVAQDRLPLVDYTSGEHVAREQNVTVSASRTGLDAVEARSSLTKDKTDNTLVIESKDGNFEIDDRHAASDSDSNDGDVAPERLVEVYLETKSRLYRIDPDTAERPIVTANRTAVATQTQKTVSKLVARMQNIERDILFDSERAAVAWRLQKPKLAREFAETHKAAKLKEDNCKPSKGVESGDHDSSVRSAAIESRDVDVEIGYALTDLFVVSESDEKDKKEANLVDVVTVRDFGEANGPDPRRLLETSCHARDADVTLEFQIISNSTYSYRHQLTIAWNKPPKFNHISPFCLKDIDIVAGKKYHQFKMRKVSSSTSWQSQSFIAVFAMFYIFSNLVQEDKSYIQLPVPWRELYEEFSVEYRTQQLSEEMELVNTLKHFVREAQYSSQDIQNFRESASAEVHAATGSQKVQTGPRHGYLPDRSSPASLRESWKTISTSAKYRKMLAARKLLPMFQKHDELISMVDAEQVSIVTGETGSGKSTQVPHFVLANEMGRGSECRILVAEPRRVSAVNLARRVSIELGEDNEALGTHGSLVGYSIRLESKVSSSTRLTFATTGVVLRILQECTEQLRPTHIVIDEVHERSVETDFLLILLRILKAEQPQLKIILMSASVQSSRLSQYYGGAPVLVSSGRTFPVQTWYLEDALRITRNDSTVSSLHNPLNLQLLLGSPANSCKYKSNQSNDSVGGKIPEEAETEQFLNEYEIQYSLILKLIQFEIQSGSDTSKAILVFLPGFSELLKLRSLLENASFEYPIALHLLHSRIANEIQQDVFLPAQEGFVKVVLATNIAETGITIPDITCVIDSGVHREMRYEERSSISRLVDSFVSKANALQRRGRAGRVKPGVCYHLLSITRYNALAPHQTPEILRSSLLDIVLRIKLHNLGDVRSVLAAALDPPSAKKIQQAISALIDFGALSTKEDLTSLGYCMSQLSLDPDLSKLVLYGSMFGCLDMASTVAAILSTKSVFIDSTTSQNDYLTTKTGSDKDGSDLLIEYGAYRKWSQACQTNKTSAQSICFRLNLNNDSLVAVEDFKARILQNLIALKLGFVTRVAKDFDKKECFSGTRHFSLTVVPDRLNMHNDNYQLLSTVIGWSMYPKLLVRNGSQWWTIRQRQTVKISRQSLENFICENKYRVVAFQNIIRNAKTRLNFAHNITPVRLLPLILHGGDIHISQLGHTITLRDASLRLSIDGDDWGQWKSTVFLRILRQKIDILCRELLRSDSGPLDAWSERWLKLIHELIDHWTDT